MRKSVLFFYVFIASITSHLNAQVFARIGTGVAPNARPIIRNDNSYLNMLFVAGEFEVLIKRNPQFEQSKTKKPASSLAIDYTRNARLLKYNTGNFNTNRREFITTVSFGVKYPVIFINSSSSINIKNEIGIISQKFFVTSNDPMVNNFHDIVSSPMIILGIIYHNNINNKFYYEFEVNDVLKVKQSGFIVTKFYLSLNAGFNILNIKSN